MEDIIELDKSHSTTRRVIKADPNVIANAVKQSYKAKDKFETVLFLPEGEGRQGEGGLRTQGYFKKSEEDNPLITIVTVVFNGEQFLEETILSVINQTYDNVEYIIIDGGSTDGTLDIIRKYERAIDYWVSEKDVGIYDAMNKGVLVASGEWLSFLNSGDVYSTKALMHVVNTDDDKFSLYIGACEYVSEKEVLYRHVPIGVNKNEVMPHPSTIVKASLFKKWGLFDLSFKIFADAVWINSVIDNEVVFYDNFPIVSMSSGGVSSSLNKDYLIESYRFRKVKNSRLTSFYIGVFRPLIGYVIRHVFGESAFNQIKIKLFRSYYKKHK